jgi:hypothetical protein
MVQLIIIYGIYDIHGNLGEYISGIDVLCAHFQYKTQIYLILNPTALHPTNAFPQINLSSWTCHYKTFYNCNL